MVAGPSPEPAAHVNTELASPEAAGSAVLEGTVITGTPADLRAASAGAPDQARDRARDPDPAPGHADGGYDETSGIVYEMSPSAGFAALGIEPDAEPPEASADGDAAAGQPSGPPSGQDGGEPAAPGQSSLVLPGAERVRVADQAEGPPQEGPQWNQTMASTPRPVEEEREGRRRGSFGKLRRGGVGATAGDNDQPPLTKVRDLPFDQRMRIWRLRALIVVIVGVVFSVIADWEVGITLAIVAGIADTVYRSRSVESHAWAQPGTIDRASWRAQRRTQRQLARMERLGYVALHRRPIPDSVEVIDHLVVGPTGVYAIDSEKWDKDLPVRAKNGKTLYYGPTSQKERLEHARWEAAQASERLSAALGRDITVQATLAIYGPKIPWDIARIREVDVFSGDRLKKYMNKRARDKSVTRLEGAEIQEIFKSASSVLPLEALKAAAPVG